MFLVVLSFFCHNYECYPYLYSILRPFLAASSPCDHGVILKVYFSRNSSTSEKGNGDISTSPCNRWTLYSWYNPYIFTTNNFVHNYIRIYILFWVSIMHLDKPICVLYFIFQHFLGKLTHDAVKLVCRIGWDYTPVKVFFIDTSGIFFWDLVNFLHLLFEAFPYSQGCAKENFIPWRIILYARLHGTPTII